MTLVSVIIPCFNDGVFLEEAVASALAQTYIPTEIIIVDDHSTDIKTLDTLKIQQDKGLKVITTPSDKKGVSAARNAGIAAAKGEYILPLDADDLIDPTYIAKAVQVLDAQPDIGICYCNARFFGLKRGRWKLPPFSLRLLLVRNIIFISAVFRRSLWQAVGGFSENHADCQEDHLFWLALVGRGAGVIQLPEVLFSYRIRPRSRTAHVATHPDAVRKAAIAVNKDIYLQHIDILYDVAMELQAEKEINERLVLWKLLNPLFNFENKVRKCIKKQLER